jgi:hypothetical protein
MKTMDILKLNKDQFTKEEQKKNKRRYNNDTINKKVIIGSTSLPFPSGACGIHPPSSPGFA